MLQEAMRANSAANEYTPKEVSVTEPIVEVGAGSSHTMLLTYSKNIYVAGTNDHGQFGVPELTQTSVPAQMPADRAVPSVSELSAGDGYTMFIDKDGKLYVTGANSAGQLGIGTTDDAPQAVPNTNINKNGVKAAGVSAGAGYTVVFDSDGFVYGFGDYSQGNASIDPNDTNSTVPVKIGERQQLIREYDVTVKKGATHTLFTYSGDKFNLYQNYTNSDSISFSSINAAIASVDGTGTITGESEGITQIVVTKGGITSICTVTVISDDYENAPMIAAGQSHVIVLKADGTVWAWGRNNYGQLGVGSAVSDFVDKPVQITLLDGKNITSVYAGENHSAAVSSDGKVYVWGANSSGQLGLGNTKNQYSPVQVTDLTAVSRVSLGT